MAPTRWSRALTSFATLWLATTIVFYSDAGAGIVALFLCGAGGALLALGVLLRLVFRRSGWVALGMLLIGVAIAWWPPPSNPLFRVRFALSERALTERAVAALKASEETTESEWIGWFHVRRVTVFDGQVRFITTPCGVVDSCGVVYAPSRPPTRYMEDAFTPLQGAWWHVFEGF